MLGASMKSYTNQIFNRYYLFMDMLDEFSGDLRLASTKQRLAAVFIDFVCIWLIGFILGYFFGEYQADRDGFGFELTGLTALLFVIAWFLLIPINEGLTGQTVGKRFLKIYVI